MTNEARKIRETIDILNLYTKAYDEGKPIVTDEQWDNIYFCLKEVEDLTGIVFPDSPTNSIHFETVSELKKVQHNHLMLSLDKTKDIKEVETFVNKPSYKEAHGWYGMFKMDGLTCSLTYKDGKLISAETRGNGVEGEDILHNALVIPSIPVRIPPKEEIVIDGEIICDWKTFNENFADEYKNPRNFASGSIRQLSNAEAASRKLTFVAWDLVKGYEEMKFNWWRLEKLDEWGFTTVPRVGDQLTVDDTIAVLDDMRNGKDAYKNDEYQYYPIDGYVFKFEDNDYCKSLGKTEHHFKSAIAYKFYDEEYETTLKYIDYDVSRNGILTPVAVFEPIEIEGSIVERASLHNMSIMEEVLGTTPYCGQHIWVIKANQIIPQVTKAVKMNYGDIISKGGVTTGLGGDYGVLCPICGSVTEIITSDSGVKNLYCSNDSCPGKLAQRIDHYCSKKGLDIKGLSRKTIEKLIDYGWINKLSDIYRLDGHKAEWISKEGFGNASVGKILDAIASSRSQTDLSAFISALGIPLVGRTVSKEIVKYYDTWDDFRSAVGGDWTQFGGFGPELNKTINSFDYTEADELAEMLAFKQNDTQNKEHTTSANIKGKTFCITGKMINYKNRDVLKDEIESLGGRVVSSMSSNVDYLINNDYNSQSAKNKKAKELGIPIIPEEKYIEMKTNAG